MKLLVLLLSIAIPWWAGVMWARLMLPRQLPGGFAIAIGAGYLIGMMITTNMLRLLGLASMGLDFWTALFLIAAVGLAARGLCLHFGENAARVSLVEHRTGAVEWIIPSIMLLVMAAYYWVLANELLSRPLYAWDAWMNWAPKAVIWFDLDTLVPFVSPKDWLAAGAQSDVHTLGNYQAWRYPESVPLQILWGMMALGETRNPLLYLPWLLVALNLTLAFYGFMRAREIPAPICIIFSCALASVPYLNVHTVLAGYADIWLCACFGIAALALAQWHKQRDRGLALLCALFALSCLQLKVPGIIFGGTIIALLAALTLPLASAVKWCAALAGCLAVVFVMAIGLDLQIPGIGSLEVSARVISLPYLGRYELTFHPVHTEALEALFSMLSWNLLWYLAILAALMQSSNAFRSPQSSIDLAVLLLTGSILFFIFFFTIRYQSLLNYATFNRAVLYLLLPASALIASVGCSYLAVAPRNRAAQEGTEKLTCG